MASMKSIFMVTVTAALRPIFSTSNWMCARSTWTTLNTSLPLRAAKLTLKHKLTVGKTAMLVVKRQLVRSDVSLCPEFTPSFAHVDLLLMYCTAILGCSNTSQHPETARPRSSNLVSLQTHVFPLRLRTLKYYNAPSKYINRHYNA